MTKPSWIQACRAMTREVVHAVRIRKAKFRVNAATLAVVEAANSHYACGNEELAAKLDAALKLVEEVRDAS